MELYDNERLEKAREFFRRDRYATENGAVIEAVGKNYAKIRLEITERHKNAVGSVMGGVYFTIADFAFAVATNVDEPNVVSLTSDISFIGVPKTGTLYAETELIKDSRTVCTFNVRVTDSAGNMIAAVKTVGYKLKK
ncbi:MAG: PaaI family thioesterase [Ruminococcus sp.]|nr:PaaI family thioesterase [Ruminococcus sp.]